jgi:hypothetical protein
MYAAQFSAIHWTLQKLILISKWRAPFGILEAEIPEFELGMIC